MVTPQEYQNNFNPVSLDLFDDRQLMHELYKRNVKPELYKHYFGYEYAKDAARDAKTQEAMEVIESFSI